NGLLVCYITDTGDALRYLQNRDLDEAALDAEALHEVALGNLARLTSGRVRLLPQGDFFGLLLDGNFEASLLLLDDLWDGALAGYPGSGLVPAVPAPAVPA